jgi:nucleoside-diphosphate-sugar epimerase
MLSSETQGGIFHMRTLITGATGRIGSRLVPRMLEQNDRVRLLVRTEEQAETFRQQGAEAVIGDLLKPDSLLSAVTGVQAIVHLAAFFRGASPAQAQAANVEGTLALAHAAQQAGVSRFIYTSTNLVYGPSCGRPAREEDQPQPSPDSAYPQTKRLAEQALQALDLDLCILRLAFVYGEGDPHLAEAARWALTWPPAKHLHMLHHTDVAQAIRLALEKSEASGKIYNVADDQPVTTAEILQINGQAATGQMEAKALEDPWEGVVDTRRIRQELGFAPIYPSVYAAIQANAL